MRALSLYLQKIMSHKIFYFILFYLLLGCSKDFKCDEVPETLTIKENKVEKRTGYSYAPEKDSLSDLQSVEFFNSQGNLVLFRHYMGEEIVRQKEYEYDKQERQIKVHDSIRGTYRIFEYKNSCDAVKSTQYSPEDKILSHIEYKDSTDFKVMRQYRADGTLQSHSLNKMDKYGNPLIIEDYQFEYEYNEKGNLLKQIGLYNGQATTTIFVRNDKGLIVKRQVVQDGRYVGGSYFTYEYYTGK